MNLKMNFTFWFHNSAKRSDPIPWRSETILSFRRCNSLRDILVRTKHRRPGAFRCNRSRCKMCPFITEGTTSYTFFSANEQRRIPHHISCSSSNLIYMIQCNKCNLQYIDETKRQLSDRFGEQRRSIEKARNLHHFNHPTAVWDLFSLPDHSIKDIWTHSAELITSDGDSILRHAKDF